MRTRLGQNFLRDPAVAARIVEAASVTPDDLVIEIGPGRGALTDFIVAARPQKIVAVEIDAALGEALKRKYPHIGMVKGDAVSADYEKICGGRRAIFIGNLPYCSATAITTSVIKGNFWKRAVFMFQKEVARRITAGAAGRKFRPKEAGYLSIIARYYSKPEILFDVKPGSFRPAPEVTSSVALFLPRDPSERFASQKDEDSFFELVGTAFSQRRKTLFNCLRSGTAADKSLILDALEAAGVKPSARAETLNIEDFKKIFSNLTRGGETRHEYPSS